MPNGPANVEDVNLVVKTHPNVMRELLLAGDVPCRDDDQVGLNRCLWEPWIDDKDETARSGFGSTQPAAIAQAVMRAMTPTATPASWSPCLYWVSTWKRRQAVRDDVRRYGLERASLSG